MSLSGSYSPAQPGGPPPGEEPGVTHLPDELHLLPQEGALSPEVRAEGLCSEEQGWQDQGPGSVLSPGPWRLPQCPAFYLLILEEGVATSLALHLQRRFSLPRPRPPWPWRRRWSRCPGTGRCGDPSMQVDQAADGSLHPADLGGSWLLGNKELSSTVLAGLRG